MQRSTSARKDPWKSPAVGIIAAGLLASGFTVCVAGAARADTFEPTNATPQVTLADQSATMTPDDYTDNGAYEIDATVSDSDTLADLNSVTLCIYEKGQNATGSCLDGALDARHTARITWTRTAPTNNFEITARSGGGTDNTFWALGTGGDSAPAALSNTFNGQGGAQDSWYNISNYVESATSMQMKFFFRPSEVAKESVNWAVKVTADDGIAQDSASDETGYTMAHHARVQTQRSPVSWGSVTTGGSATPGSAQDVSSGTLVTNGGTDVQMSTSTFTDTQTTLSNAGGTTNTNGVNSVFRGFAIDVDPGAGAYDGTGTTRLSASLADVETSVLSSGTTESGDTTPAQSFKLWLGTNIPRLNTNSYQGTISIGVTAD